MRAVNGFGCARGDAWQGLSFGFVGAPGRISARPGWRALINLLRGERWRLVVAVAAMTGAGLLQLVFPWVTGQLVDSAVLPRSPAQSGETASLNAIAMVLGVIVLAVMILSYFETWFFAAAGERALAAYRMETYAHLVSLPMRFFSRRPAGDLASRVHSDLGILQEFLTSDLRMLVRYGFMAAGGMVMLFITAPGLAFVVAAVIPVAVAAAFFAGRGIRAATVGAQDGLARTGVVLEETLQGIGTVKAFCAEDHETRRYRELMGAYLKPALRGLRYRALFVCGIIFLLLATLVFIMWSGSSQVALGRLTPGDFTRFMFYLAFAASAGGTLAELVGRMQKALGAQDRIRELLEEGKEERSAPAGAVEVPAKAGIGFEAVAFAYPDRPEVAVLDKVSFVVEPGRRVALAGPSGAGKSTVAALLLRFFEPGAGRIVLGGVPIAELSLHVLRSKIAYVPQEVLLFNGTIGENIAYGRPGCGMADVEWAARRAQAHDFIAAMPLGYGTVLGDRGTGLSGGQRQRIAIARALLRDAPILLLDEATSSLDAENEQKVESAMRELMKDRATLVIAHRLSTVRQADEILVLSHGRVVERGTHEALYGRSGFYRMLYDQRLEL
ncbi:MAG TPA: ABC transporter transmembrane domain-containing protein [Verrucomicrobiales bacterium]|nr:ABC transporter transmembrane domain-containing protein [Verrucomicrobiales bacterium]